jgi:hypothetical protein
VSNQKPFLVLRLDSLKWPRDIQIPVKRFRLFVAADASHANVDALSDFALSALQAGMVYFCSWGPDCERFHDIVDEVAVEDAIGERLYVGKHPSDVIMTTSHDDEPLEEALYFFTNCTCPTAGFETNSNFWVAVCVDNSEWAATIERHLRDADLPVGDWPPNRQ